MLTFTCEYCDLSKLLLPSLNSGKKIRSLQSQVWIWRNDSQLQLQPTKLQRKETDLTLSFVQKRIDIAQKHIYTG